MSTAVPALDPGEAIAGAMRDLYDQLREIVDRGPTDDPGLLDELGRLTGRIRSRITRARKRAVAAAEPVAEKPAKPAKPAVPAATPATAKPTVAPTVKPDPAPRTVPAATPSASPRVTVPIKPPSVTPTPATSTRRVWPARLPLWVHALAILLIVAGVALGTAVTGWALVAVPTGAVVLGAARWNVRRQTRGGAR
jgi:hypothetical protein